MTISVEFSEVLRAGRHNFNGRVTEARHRYTAFDYDLFSHFLTHCVGPFVTAVPYEHRGSVASAAFDVALDLTGRELCGAHTRGALLNRLWIEVLPALVPVLPAQPAPLLCALCNALLNLQAQGARAGQWLQLLLEQGPQTNEKSLLDIGLLAAWLAGAVQFRTAALRVAAAHPHAAREMLGLRQNCELSEKLHHLKNDPWYLAPTDIASTGHEVGNFIGFGTSFGASSGVNSGGVFESPPCVRACSTGFVVKSADRYFLLLADGFGKVLLPASVDEYVAAANYQPTISQAPALEGGNLCTPRGPVELSLCPDSAQLAWNEHSVALFSPYSFSICVIPWR